MELALTGEMIGAERLYDYGLVNRLTEPDGALAEAMHLAVQITENAPMSVATSKRIITEQIDWPLDKMFEIQASITGHILGSEDAREGARAFAEKRSPNWKGR
jgi:enoyl-CoA hydratase